MFVIPIPGNFVGSIYYIARACGMLVEVDSHLHESPVIIQDINVGLCLVSP